MNSHTQQRTHKRQPLPEVYHRCLTALLHTHRPFSGVGKRDRPSHTTVSAQLRNATRPTKRNTTASATKTRSPIPPNHLSAPPPLLHINQYKIQSTSLVAPPPVRPSIHTNYQSTFFHRLKESSSSKIKRNWCQLPSFFTPRQDFQIVYL